MSKFNEFTYISDTSRKSSDGIQIVQSPSWIEFSISVAEFPRNFEWIY